jgi:YesN/AraC family two-component response regulator
LPDIIISDVMMAGIDGYEFCARIKDDMRYCHIPVILLTARNSLPDQIQGYQTGADDYISKPFEESLLIARIENLLAKKERIRRQLITENGDLNRNAEISSLDYAFMEKLMQVIRQHYSNPDFDVNDIVDKMGISRSVLYSKLKSLSNQSISEIITNYRLQKSTELLQKSNMSISEVAMECGFYDPAYFSRVFKQRYGISPKAFRDESKTNNV